MKEVMINSYENNLKCDNCGASPVLTIYGYTCSSCGVILEPNYTADNYMMVRSENSEIKNGRQFVGLGKQLDNVSHLGSYIDFYKTGFFVDVRNNPLDPEKQKLFYRLKFTREFHSRLNQNETYYRVVKIMKDVANTFEISSDIKKRAVYLYNKIIKATRTQKQKIPNHVSLMATCLFISLKELPFYAPITIQELCNTFNNLGHRVNSKMIIRDILKFKHLVEIKNIKHDSKDYLERLINKLYHSDSFRNRFHQKAGSSRDLLKYTRQLLMHASKILDLISKSIKDCRNPFILAGASIYGADILLTKKEQSKRVLTQKILAESTGIAEYSIRDHYCSVIKPVMMGALGKLLDGFDITV